MTVSSSPHRFLVSAVNGDLGEASAQVLGEIFTQATIYGIDAEGSWPGRFYCSSVLEIPRGDTPEYVDRLLEIISSLEITHLVPCSDAELSSLAKADAQATFPCKIIMPQGDLVTTFVDKWLSHQWLERRGFPVPRTTLLTQATQDWLPLIAKPRMGSGSAGIFEVGSELLLDGLKEEFGDSYVAQEHLGNETPEYTCALIAHKGESHHIIFRRKLDAGRTVMITVEKMPNISSLLDDLVKATNLQGPLNIQLKSGMEGPKIFEVNPRLSSTVRMRHVLGFRDLEWAVKASESSSDSPDLTVPDRATVYRLSEERIVPRST